MNLKSNKYLIIVLIGFLSLILFAFQHDKKPNILGTWKDINESTSNFIEFQFKDSNIAKINFYFDNQLDDDWQISANYHLTKDSLEFIYISGKSEKFGVEQISNDLVLLHHPNGGHKLKRLK